MPQVITPPSLGQQEAESKNWYRAEALRKIINDLTPLRDEIVDPRASEAVAKAWLQIGDAIDLLEMARRELDPRLNRVRIGGS